MCKEVATDGTVPNVFAELGDHHFLAVGNHEIDLCHVDHVIVIETERWRALC